MCESHNVVKHSEQSHSPDSKSKDDWEMPDSISIIGNHNTAFKQRSIQGKVAVFPVDAVRLGV